MSKGSGKEPMPSNDAVPAGGKPVKTGTKQGYDVGHKSGGGKAPFPSSPKSDAPLPPKKKQGEGTPGAGKP